MTLFADDLASAPRVLALDLSLAATGICTPEGVLTTFKPSTEGEVRLHEIADHVTYCACPLPVPDLVVIEDGVVRSPAAFKLGMLHGAVRDRLIHDARPYLVVPPATLKTYATGRGNATKPDMRMELYRRADIDERDDNRCDAWWLRALALDLLGHPVLALPQTHRRALDKLTLPIGAHP